MEPYLTSRSLQVIALSDNDSYYRVLESNPTIAQRFEKVELDESSADSVTRVLADQANYLEAREHVFFTYPALRTIAEGALRYFPSGVMPDKAIDLMLEIAPFVRQKGERVVEKEDVNELIQSKTGIAVGEVKEEEKEKLMTLEVELHRRVVGQNEAIKAIANALRRSRAGVGNPLRPLGSFLFLGPTGVGKTETAKALAHVFFGGEDSMIRIDMTEYQSEDALDKLIGSFESGRAGVLATYLKEKPYGVLLLDEFEKSNPQVLDLFLQVLDEGVFSDMAGHRINARNVIIIATSNAGSQRIWEYFKAGENPSAHKDELIDHLISRSLFKPELINRFDAVVVYEPHAEESLKKIALLMLERLKKRLAERGVAFAISDDVIEYVVRKGYDPKFGARPMNRVIQEDIEEVIARKLITGEIKEGGTFSLSSLDLLRPQGENERIPEQSNHETGQNIASGMNF